MSTPTLSNRLAKHSLLFYHCVRPTHFTHPQNTHSNRILVRITPLLWACTHNPRHTHSYAHQTCVYTDRALCSLLSVTLTQWNLPNPNSFQRFPLRVDYWYGTQSNYTARQRVKRWWCTSKAYEAHKSRTLIAHPVPTQQNFCCLYHLDTTFV